MSIAEKLTTIAENQQKVYDAGHEEGHTTGYQEGYDVGYREGHTSGLTQDTKFWADYQEKGARVNWDYAFAGWGWTDDTFCPKYPIILTGFQPNTRIFSDSAITDLKARLDEMGVYVDTAKASTLSYLFYQSAITRVGTIDVGQCSNLTAIFASTTNFPLQIVYIEKFKLSDANIHTHGSNTFRYLTQLSDICVEGTIYKSIYFQWCPLSVDSMKSIISCLTNYTGTSSANTMTVKFSDDCWTALEASGAAPDGNTWTEYVQSTLCWNT